MADELIDELVVDAVPSGQEPATKEQIIEEERTGVVPPEPQNIENVQIAGDDSGSALDSLKDGLGDDKPPGDDAEEIVDDKPKDSKPKDSKPKDSKPKDSKPEDGKDGAGDDPANSGGDGKSGDGANNDGVKADPKAEGDGDPEKSLDEELDEIKLGPYAKPKTSEGFAKVKEVAKRRVTEAEEKAAKVQQELEEIKSQGGVKDEERKELEELREFRAKIDVENAPVFQEFDNKLANNDKVIFKALKNNGFSEEQISKIQKLGVDNVNWEPIKEHLTATNKALVERKVSETIGLKADREIAVEEAKVNAKEFLTTSQKKEAERATQASAEILKNVKDLALPEIPKNATPEAKKVLKERYDYIKSVRDQIDVWAASDKPEDRAELAVGTALAHVFSKQLAFTQKKLGGIEEEHAKVVTEKESKISDLTKQLDEANKELARMTKAGGLPSRRNANPGKVTLPSRQFESGESALDAIRDEVAAN